jgi:protein transport protein SEC20
VEQSAQTTTALAQSSAVLRDTHHSGFAQLAATIRQSSGLLSRYGRRQTTDTVLIVAALALYFGVVIYILAKRFPLYLV